MGTRLLTAMLLNFPIECKAGNVIKKSDLVNRANANKRIAKQFVFCKRNEYRGNTCNKIMNIYIYIYRRNTCSKGINIDAIPNIASTGAIPADVGPGPF